jgi:hypothetical protein
MNESMRTGAHIAALLLAIWSLVACSSQRQSPEKAPMRIEILGFEDCPNTPIIQANTEEAVRTLGLRADIEYVDQQALASNDRRRGWPAPTILVAGRDLFGMSAPSATTMSCRVYPNGIPSADAIGRALELLVEP